MTPQRMNRSIWSAVAAYVMWGCFPVYFKWLDQVPALEMIAHRIVWSCVMLGAVILITGQWREFRDRALRLGMARSYLLAALLLAVNWLVYVWAVNAGFIMEASLGYFINPLISVVMGVLLLHEKLRRWQWVAVSLAMLGVIYLTVAHGSLPWIALALAGTFALYGLIKKTSSLGALYGLALESGILLMPALAYLLLLEGTGHGAFLHVSPLIDLLLVGTGLVTALPLLLFAAAAQRIPLVLLGVLQYLAPTLQFTIAVVIYHEPFSSEKAIGFGIIWAGLVVFAVDGFLVGRRKRLE